MDDFPPDKITERKFTGASGMEYTTKQKPLDSVENSIQRTGKDLFTVDTTFRSTEITEKCESLPHEKTEHLEFSLADKKRTLHFLSAMYMEAGRSEADAKSMAKEVYSKAEAQSPETVLRIEEVRQDSMTVAYGKASVVLSTADRQEAAEKIAELGVSPQTAETLVEKAQEIREEAAAKHDTLISNGHEMHPEGNVLDALHAETPVPDAKPHLPVPDVPDVPDMPKPTPRGARK